jgi:hypothetical protein
MPRTLLKKNAPAQDFMAGISNFGAELEVFDHLRERY